jgi:hypothetical protein
VLFTVVTIKPGGGGGRSSGLQHPKYYTVKPEDLDALRAKIEKDDEEIIAIIMSALEVLP